MKSFFGFFSSNSNHKVNKNSKDEKENFIPSFGETENKKNPNSQDQPRSMLIEDPKNANIDGIESNIEQVSSIGPFFQLKNEKAEKAEENTKSFFNNENASSNFFSSDNQQPRFTLGQENQNKNISFFEKDNNYSNSDDFKKSARKYFLDIEEPNYDSNTYSDYDSKTSLSKNNNYQFFDPTKWSIKDFEIGRPIGRGQFGKVYLARTKKEKFICALKVIEKKKLEEFDHFKHLKRELIIHSNLKHRNILQLYGYFWDQKRFYMILEFATDGDLFSYQAKQVT